MNPGLEKQTNECLEDSLLYARHRYTQKSVEKSSFFCNQVRIGQLYLPELRHVKRPANFVFHMMIRKKKPT